MAKFVVIGAGVVGVATAWQLCKAGHRVTLVDKNSGVCGGASHKNGAQLSYSYCDSLASPGLLAKMPSILLGRDSAFNVHMQADPHFLLWGLRFVLNASPRAFSKNTQFLLQMAAETKELLAQLLTEFPLSFDWKVPGKLVLCHNEDAWQHADKQIEMKRAVGIKIDKLDRAAVEELEPALTGYPDSFVGAIYSHEDAVGDPVQFSAGLVAGLKTKFGLRTRFETEVTRLEMRGGRVSGIAFRNSETEECDGVVLATGYDTRLIAGASKFGAIWPMQGYSITVPANDASPKISITDPSRRLVFARLGDKLRIAGIADIGPRAFTFKQARYEILKTTAASAFPDGISFADEQGWSDARPCTPSSRPIINRGKVPGVYLNLGHGTLGWTLCLGSAKRLANLVAEDKA